MSVVRVVVAGRVVVPDVGADVAVDALFAYDGARPFEVRVVFRPVVSWGEGAEWVFARELLVRGLDAPAGEGDVRVRPGGDGTVVIDMFTSVSACGELGPERAFWFTGSAAEVEEFARLALALVPAGDECLHLDVDAAFAGVLAGGEPEGRPAEGGPVSGPSVARPGSGARLGEVIAGLRVARAGLLAVSDPRDAGPHLEAVRSCVAGVAAAAGDMADLGRAYLCDADAAGEAVRGLRAACRGLLTVVDQFLVGITEARRLTAGQCAGGDAEAFVASRCAVRLLLDDRAAVDDAVDELLRAADGYLELPPGPGRRDQ